LIYLPYLWYRFNKKDVKELRYITRRDAFTYPVCLDEKDDFNALNRFPGEMTFIQTLDCEKKFCMA
jgi:hypothetical protein